MHSLLVLTAADGEQELPLGDGRQLLVFEPRPGLDMHVRLGETRESNEDCRAEVRLSGDRLLVYSLRAYQALTVNGMNPSYEDGAAILEAGDVLTIDEVSLRFLAPGVSRGADGDASGSYVEVTSDDGTASEQVAETDAKVAAAAGTSPFGSLPAVSAVAEKRAREGLRGLAAIAREAILTDDPKLIIQRTLDRIAEQLPDGCCGSVMWRVATGGAWKRVARAGPGKAPVGQSIIRHFARSTDPVLLSDAGGEFGPDADVRSLLCVPVVRGSGVSGIVILSHPEAGRFDETDKVMLGAAAETLATALDAIDQGREKEATKTRDAKRAGRRLEHVLEVARLKTGETGITLGEITVATRFVDRGDTTGAFAEAIPSPMPGSPSRTLVGLGEVLGQAPVVDAARAVAAIRALAPHRVPPGAIVGEISRVLAVAGIPPAGTAMVAVADPADARILLFASGRPVAIRLDAASGVAVPVHLPTTSEGLNAPDGPQGGRPTPVPFAPGDIVVLIAGGFASAAKRMLDAFCEALGGQQELAAILDALSAGVERAVVPGRCASVVLLRRDR